MAKAQEGLEGLAVKWNVSVLRRSGECERIEVADFELSEFFNRIASVEGKAMNSCRSSASAAGASWETRRTAGGSRSIRTAASFREIGSMTERAGTSTARSADLAQMNV